MFDRHRRECSLCWRRWKLLTTCVFGVLLFSSVLVVAVLHRKGSTRGIVVADESFKKRNPSQDIDVLDDDLNNNYNYNYPIISKPILFLHGIGGHADEFDDIIEYIKTKFGPRAPTMHSIDICEGSCSIMTPMMQQRDDIIEYLLENSITLNISNNNGFHWVTHSQGAILSRSVIQKQQLDLKVDTYISMAGPQMGQWGECSMNRSDIPDEISQKMSRPYGWIFFYNTLAQHELSFSNYWHDPKHINKMVKEAKLLPTLNGYDISYNMSQSKTNFLLLKKAVFLGSQDDDCINPPLSSVFEFIKEDGETIQTLEESIEYRNDTFGIKTMMQQNRLVVQNYPGIEHLDWRKPEIFEKYVLPHLIDTKKTSIINSLRK